MSEPSTRTTYTFETDGYRFTVKYQFFDKYKNYPVVFSENVYNLMTTYQLASYLHNPNGPAIENIKTGQKQYFIDGKSLPVDIGQKIQYDGDYNDYLGNLLDL